MIKTANRLKSTEEYYFSKKLKEVRALAASGKPIINLGIGSPDLDPPANVVAVLISALNDKGAHQYQSYQGIPEFREAIAGFYSRNFNVCLNPESEILPLMGSKEGILHISLAFLNVGDSVLIPNPGYPTYEAVTKLVQANPVLYDLKAENNWLPDFEALEKLDLSAVKIMWVNYPNMPTGATADKKFFENLIAFGKKHSILIVNDNPYSFILNDSPLSILSVDGAKDFALELNTLSKSFNLSGWRIGMVLGKQEYLDAILKVKSNMDSGMFYPIQKGAIAALNFDMSWFTQLNKSYESRRKIAWNIAEVLSCSYAKNSSGLFVWAKLKAGISSEEFIDKLLHEKSIFITPGKIFGSNGEGYIRISLCASEAELKEALSRLKIGNPSKLKDLGI